MKVTAWMLGMLWVVGMVLVAGCVPERVSWSPDGLRGTVMGEDELRFCDAAGKLSQVRIMGVHGAVWLPDGKSVVVVREVEAKKTWKEVAEVLPREAEEAQKNAAAILKIIQQHEGSFEDVNEFTKQTAMRLQLMGDEYAMALMYLREQETEALKAKAGEAVWKMIEKEAPGMGAAQVYEVKETEAKAGPILAYFMTPGTVYELRVSPTGQAVAISKGRTGRASSAAAADIAVAALDGSGVRLRVKESCFPDWTADGQWLVFFRGASRLGGDVAAGTLVRRRMVDDKGVLLGAGFNTKEETLAQLAFDGASRVRVGKGGRVYFASAEYPVVGEDLSEGLFYIDPGKEPATVTRVVGRESEKLLSEAGQTLAFFEMSRDGSWISVPYGDGRVMVIETATGKAELVQATAGKEGNDLQLATVPVWRTAGELTFVRPGKDGADRELVLYSVTEKKTTVISGEWPEALKDGWLTAPGR